MGPEYETIINSDYIVNINNGELVTLFWKQNIDSEFVTMSFIQNLDFDDVTKILDTFSFPDKRYYFDFGSKIKAEK